jgi:hypothetical protein
MTDLSDFTDTLYAWLQDNTDDAELVFAEGGQWRITATWDGLSVVVTVNVATPPPADVGPVLVVDGEITEAEAAHIQAALGAPSTRVHVVDLGDGRFAMNTTATTPTRIRPGSVIVVDRVC